jgi:hypothetical protein
MPLWAKTLTKDKELGKSQESPKVGKEAAIDRAKKAVKIISNQNLSIL